MRACWIDAGNDPDYAKLKAAGIDSAYFDIREERLSRAYFDSVRAHGFGVGVYAAANWYGNVTGPQFADIVNSRLEVIAKGSRPDEPAVCLDIEVKDPSFILGALRRWRAHRPDRVTDWTLEGHQGGILTTAQWLIVAGLVRFVVPQCYDGAMTTSWDDFAMARDLYDHGLPFGSIVPFIDASRLLPWWQGYAFTQGRLP